MNSPSRGDVWKAQFNPVVGHEQGGYRPCLVVSANELNKGPAELVIVLPITSVEKDIPSHVRIDPPAGGVTEPSFIKCEDVRSISTERLARFTGTVDTKVMTEVEYRLRFLLGI